MKSEDRKSVASAIAKKSQRVTLEELASKGRRSIHVITAQDALRAIESVVDETLSRCEREITGPDRDSVVEEAKNWFRRASKIQSEPDPATRERTEVVDRIEALENRVNDELSEIKKSLKTIQEKPTGPDPEFIKAIINEFSAQQESKHEEWETRLVSTLGDTVDTIRKTVMSAMRGTDDCQVEATDLVVSKIFEDQNEQVESNVTDLDVGKSTLGKGVSKNLARLKAMLGHRRSPEDDAGEQQEPETGASRLPGAPVSRGSNKEREES